MTTHPVSPATGPTSSSGSNGDQAAPPVDFVLAGRAVSAGAHIAGLIAAAQMDTAGTPRKLPADMWPDEDPVLVQAIWDRALVVGVRAGQLMGAPRFNRDKLARLQGQLMEAGHVAMGGMVARSLSTVEQVPEPHPVDAETGREH
jgi:hypothetical protein